MVELNSTGNFGPQLAFNRLTPKLCTSGVAGRYSKTYSATKRASYALSTDLPVTLKSSRYATFVDTSRVTSTRAL